MFVPRGEELRCFESFLLLCDCHCALPAASLSDGCLLNEGKDIRLAQTPRWGCSSQIKIMYGVFFYYFFFIKPAAFTALGALCCLGVQSTAKIHSVAVLGGAGGADALSLCF